MRYEDFTVEIVNNTVLCDVMTFVLVHGCHRLGRTSCLEEGIFLVTVVLSC